MDVLSDEHEREEAVRRWWHENWKPLAAGVLIALAAIIGYKQYQAWSLQRAQERAHEVYRLQQALSAGADGAADQARAFMDGHGDVYGALVAMELASTQLSAGEQEAALASLTFVQAHGGEFMAPLAALLEARVRAAGGDYERALSTLAGVGAATYAAEVAELSGDIRLQQGDRAGAHEAYAAALAALRSRQAPVSPLLEMKHASVTPQASQEEPAAPPPAAAAAAE